MECLNEEQILTTLKNHYIFVELKGTRYNFQSDLCNFYQIGRDSKNIIGELDFSKKFPLIRINLYQDGYTYYKSKFIKTEQDLTNVISLLKLSIGGIKCKQIDDIKKELIAEFED